MKKITLVITLVASVFCANAQTANLSGAQLSKGGNAPVTVIRHAGINQQLSVPFWSEDFSGGVVPAGWTNVDNLGNNIVWTWTNTGAINMYTGIDMTLSATGTTAGNGWLQMDSDAPGMGTSEDAVLTTSAINCTGHANVHLSFNEYYAQYLATVVTLSVSNDNTNWTVILDYSLFGQGQVTPNPNVNDFDITAVAANQATVYLRFEMAAAWDYWWYIDDLQLFEPAVTDLTSFTINDPRNGYTMIPLLQASGLNLSGVIKNVGASPTTGGSALFEVINTGTTLTEFTEPISLPTIAVGDTFRVTPAGAFTPSGVGSYMSRITVTVAGDGNAANDMIESAVAIVSDTIYARDDDTNAGSLGIGAGAGSDGIVGQNFNITVPTQLTSVTFFLSDAMNPNPSGSPTWATVHPQVPGSEPDAFTILGTSETLMVMPGTIATGGQYFTLGFVGGPITFAPGLYYIGMHEVDSLLTLGRTNSIFTPNTVWVSWNTIPSPPAVNGWAPSEAFSFLIAYQLRMNFGNDPVGIAEPASSLVSVYPNPTTGNIYISNKEKAIDYVVNVFNSLGEKVYADKINNFTNAVIDLSKNAAGIYHLQMISDSGTVNQSIVISGR